MSKKVDQKDFPVTKMAMVHSGHHAPSALPFSLSSVTEPCFADPPCPAPPSNAPPQSCKQRTCSSRFDSTTVMGGA